MDRIGHNLLYLLRQPFLQRLGNLGVACGVRDFTRLRIGAGVVEGVRDLVFYTCGYLCIVC